MTSLTTDSTEMEPREAESSEVWEGKGITHPLVFEYSSKD